MRKFRGFQGGHSAKAGTTFPAHAVIAADSAYERAPDHLSVRTSGEQARSRARPRWIAMQRRAGDRRRRRVDWRRRSVEWHRELMAITVEVVLVGEERRTVSLPGHMGSLANALSRLDDWIPTQEGGWVQKSAIVEVRGVARERDVPRGTAVEFERLSDAAETLAGQGQR